MPHTSLGKKDHGYSRHPLYLRLVTFLDACYNENGKPYKTCGARGIRVSNEWCYYDEKLGTTCGRYLIFISWVKENLGDQPSPDYALTRIDRDRDYEPGNLYWKDKRKLTLKVAQPRLPKHAWTPKNGHKHYLYTTLRGMLQRCYDPKHKSYNAYGGRGVTICLDWFYINHRGVYCAKFPEFITYILGSLGERPAARYSLDRINNAGNYEPGNLRWASPEEQAKNKLYKTQLIRGML